MRIKRFFVKPAIITIVFVVLALLCSYVFKVTSSLTFFSFLASAFNIAVEGQFYNNIVSVAGLIFVLGVELEYLRTKVRHFSLTAFRLIAVSVIADYVSEILLYLHYHNLPMGTSGIMLSMLVITILYFIYYFLFSKLVRRYQKVFFVGMLIFGLAVTSHGYLYNNPSSYPHSMDFVSALLVFTVFIFVSRKRKLVRV